jgi:glucosamine kinase
MKIIMDAGGSKIDILERGNGKRFRLPGFNPLLHPISQLADTLGTDNELINNLALATNIDYYGAGCRQNEPKETIKKLLQKLAPNALIQVHHDLDLLTHCWTKYAPCFVCIAGTGSNSMLIETSLNGNITNRSLRPSLGYILGDEGGGVWFGKRLLHDYFGYQMPDALRKSFGETYAITLAETLQKTYKTQGANTYIASFAPFMAAHQNEPYIQALLKEGFAAFIRYFIPEDYHQQQAIPLNFAGSIAYYYQKELQEVALSFGLQINEIVASPLDALSL